MESKCLAWKRAAAATTNAGSYPTSSLLPSPSCGVGVNVDVVIVVGLCKVRLGQRFPCAIFVYLHSFGKKSIELNLATTPLEIRSKSIAYRQETHTHLHMYVYRHSDVLCMYVCFDVSTFSQYEVGNFPVARTKKVFQAANDGETHKPAQLENRLQPLDLRLGSGHELPQQYMYIHMNTIYAYIRTHTHI